MLGEDKGDQQGWPAGRSVLPDEGVSGADYLQQRVSASQRRVTPCSFHSCALSITPAGTAAGSHLLH